MAAAEQAWPAPPPFRRRDPPAPVEGEFSMYGVTRSTGPPVAPPLEEQVYAESAADVCAELRQLNRSLLQSFLELTQLMARSPSQCCDKGARPPATRTTRTTRTTSTAHATTRAVADLRTLFLNFQHLLNTYRPHEAREALIAIVRQQAAAKRQLSDELEAACAEAARSVSEELREPAEADADALALAPPHHAPMALAPPAAAPAASAGEAHAGPRGRDPPGLGALERLLTTLEGVP